jgi:hypothetical protein
VHVKSSRARELKLIFKSFSLALFEMWFNFFFPRDDFSMESKKASKGDQWLPLNYFLNTHMRLQKKITSGLCIELWRVIKMLLNRQWDNLELPWLSKINKIDDFKRNFWAHVWALRISEDFNHLFFQETGIFGF